jgi:2-C-methyl-D-erythritol 2,4-cyclodiphosphate synthase
MYHRHYTMNRSLALLSFLAVPVTSFVVAGAGLSSTALAASVATEDDLTKPAYEIEPVSFRIGHGFDIHRMAPIGEAGQPVIIGGVEIPHKDQKVSHSIHCSIVESLFVILWVMLI